MIKNKNILVVGAGNAGRPVANLLNFLDNKVHVTDINAFDNLPKKAQKEIKTLKKKNIDFELGNHDFNILNDIDEVFISPNIPKNSKFIQKIHDLKNEGKLNIIQTKDIGDILNSLITVPMIGIAGTDGKTTTTNMINFILQEKFNTLIFSSLQNSLVIEGLVEMIINREENLNFNNNEKELNSEKKSNSSKNQEKIANEKDLAIFELPHGTIRMAEGLDLDAGVLTNLTPDHMDEFNSFEEYIERNIAIEDLVKKNGIMLLNGDDPIISTRLSNLNSDYILFGLGNPQKIIFENKTYYNPKVDLDVIAKDIELNGIYGSKFKIIGKKIPTLVCSNCNQINCNCKDFKRKYIGPFEENLEIKVPGMVNVENAVSTFLMSLIMGLKLKESCEKLSSFKGVKGRFEKIDVIDDINIFMDAAHNPESMEKLFKGLDIPGRLIISLDNPDTLTSRDKSKIGEVLSKSADILISSCKNETTGILDSNASLEILKGVNDLETHTTKSVSESILKALTIAKDNDTILHIGPGVVNAYDNVKNEIEETISFFKAISGKVVVVGGCGTVGSLIARVLNSHEVDVTISDSNDDCFLKDVFEKENIGLNLGNHDENLLKEASSFFLAPSLFKNKKLIAKLKSINNIPIFGLEDVLKYFPSDKHVFGITGTNGKTTTTELLKHIFKKAGLNIGEHYLNIQGNTEFIPALQSRLNGDVAVVEIGTFGNKGEIEKSAKNSNVETALITNISKDHLSNGNFSDYINCKKEIIDIANNLILNADDPLVSYFKNFSDNDGDILYFGIDEKNTFKENLSSKSLNSNDFLETINCPNCGRELNYFKHYLDHLGNFSCDCGFKNPKNTVKAKNIDLNFNTNEPLEDNEKKINQTKYTLEIANNQAKIILSNGGIANIYNSLAAATASWLHGIDFNYIVEGINSFEGVSGRGEIIKNNPKIISDYAHNPAGVKSIIQTVLSSKLEDEKLIILNTIASESGEEGDIKIAKLLSFADVVIPVSNSSYNLSKYINTKVKHIKSSCKGNKVGTLGATFKQLKEAIDISLEIANEKDIILILGEGGLKFSKKILNNSNK